MHEGSCVETDSSQRLEQIDKLNQYNVIYSNQFDIMQKIFCMQIIKKLVSIQPSAFILRHISVNSMLISLCNVAVSSNLKSAITVVNLIWNYVIIDRLSLHVISDVTSKE